MPIRTLLTDADVEHFLQKGYIILRDCFSRDFAREWREFAFTRLGFDPDRPETWTTERVHLPRMNLVEVRTFAPTAWAAICDLLGGEDRLADPQTRWGDSFIINFNMGADRPWEPPSANSPGWHKDGDFFRHFLDSPEQGLLTIVVWSDIEPKSGGTFIACDSVRHVARYLAAHPEGLHPSQGGFGHLIRECTEFVELTGRAGDVVIHHPFMLHAHSQNPSGRPRFITNPPVALKEPMNFNRETPNDFSPVERAVLRALDVERYDFRPTAPYEKIVPERIRIQQKMLEEQQARLTEQG